MIFFWISPLFPENKRKVSVYAMGEDKPKSTGLLSGTLRVLGMVLKARLDGSYKHTPFFVLESGAPIVTPKVLSDRELKDVMDTV
jgi:hypothetical protein